MKTETYVCQSCGLDVTRPVARGQRPKWCPACRSGHMPRRRTFVCEHCGQTTEGFGKLFCSVACSNRAKPPRPKKPKPPPRSIDQRSDLRRAVEDGDPEGVIAAIRAMSAVDEHGCWIWQRRIRDGYPEARIGGRSASAHRLALEAKHGSSLGSQHAHHICAKTACVNPEHLQPVTHRDNIAEMLARQSYLARIRELEDALALVAPAHPLLRVIAVA